MNLDKKKGLDKINYFDNKKTIKGNKKDIEVTEEKVRETYAGHVRHSLAEKDIWQI